MIGKHPIIPTYKNRKPWVYVYNSAILLPGHNRYYHYKKLASQTGLNQSSTNGYALSSLGQQLFAEWPLYSRYSEYCRKQRVSTWDAPDPHTT